MPKDYSLLAGAEDAALASPGWYRSPVDPSDIRRLSQKSDQPALRDAILWLGLIAASGALAVALTPSWWALPFWLVYGVLYASASDARWHECGHRTAFKTPWMNEALYQIASFFLMRNPHVWRASHVRHHTDTIIVGRDPEIAAMRPPDLLRLALNVFGLPELRQNLLRWSLHLQGRVHPEEAQYVRDTDLPKITRVARIWAAIIAAVLVSAALLGSWVPLLLVVTPRLYGSWHMAMTGALQHLGLAENVTDHRLNTRTVHMNAVHRFLYLNMNYHLEHHMFTMVPYHRLPDLHALIKDDCPPAEPSILAAYGRLLPVLWRQLRYQDAVIIGTLPEGARPYRPEVERLRPHAV